MSVDIQKSQNIQRHDVRSAIVAVWLDPRCATHDAHDRRNLHRANCKTMKLAIRRAMNGEPTRELIADRHTIQQSALEGVRE